MATLRTLRQLSALCVLPFILHAQQITGIQVPKKERVTFSPEAQTIVANKPTTLQLHFLIQPGFHINSHTPHNATLIATKLAVEDDAAFSVKKVDFPTGHDYTFASDPSNKLDVYSGDFTLTAHVLAKPGTHTLKAALGYQACDTASCYPPRALPVTLTFTAK